MKILLSLTLAGLTLTAAPALAQLPSATAPIATPGLPSKVTVPAQPAGNAIYKGGQAVVVASGAHGGGPAPVVTGGVSEAGGFANGVTDGTSKVGKGIKTTGQDVGKRGVTVRPAGAVKGAMTVPGNLQTQADRAAEIPK